MLSLNTTYRRTLPDGSTTLHTITTDTELKYHSGFAAKYPQVKYEVVVKPKPKIHISDANCTSCEG